MILLALHEVSFDHGGPLLLDRVDWSIEDGERLALVGRNGTGKSSLLGILAGELEPSGGRLSRRQKLRVAKLGQTPVTDLAGTVGDLVRRNVAEAGHDGFMASRRIAAVLEPLALDPDRPLAELSAGTLRRALLAGVLAAEPDLLLLDEPTNHLDIESVKAVEDVVRGFAGAVVFVSHDRRFVEALATGIVELDRGKLARYPGGWAKFVERRDAALEAEERARAEADKVRAAEEAWLRRGVKARRARNMGRVRELMAMREEHRARRHRPDTADLRIFEAERSGRIVVRAKGLAFSYGDREIVAGLDLDLQRGDRLGVVGPNGCGKSTLVKLLLGEIAPDRGEVRHGTGLAPAWFDQHQAQLDPDRRVQDVVGEGASVIEVGSERRHVISYLEDFLFTAEQCRSAVSTLSGGERNRLMLARIFAKPMNLLVLDEPTNDLDIETLELLESVIAGFPGTLILVSHDRAFLDNVVTSTLVHEGGGRWKEYDGGYADYERARASAPPKTAAPPGPRRSAAAGPAVRPEKPAKLGNKERRELEELPGRIEALEAEREALHETMAAPAYFKQDGAAIAAAADRLAALSREIEDAYARWSAFLDLA